MKGHIGRDTANSQGGGRYYGDMKYNCLSLMDSIITANSISYIGTVYNPFSLSRLSISVAVSVPAVVVALQVYCPPWDVRTRVKLSMLMWATVETLLVITSISLSILISRGHSHCTVRSSVSEPPSSRVTEQVREKGSPAVSFSVVEIVTLGSGAEEWMKYTKYHAHHQWNQRQELLD